jgi:O-antigen/teichoic acid export membrane protein
VLTRLLAPEFFGLMVLVRLVSQGVIMFSDVGLRGSVVHHERGDDARFLDTAWTIAALRGGILWIIVAAAAAPVAGFYEEPRLEWLIPIAGLGVLITGFQSTSLYTLVRHINAARRVVFELGCQLSGIVVMISWAALSPTIWALVAGLVVRAIVQTVASHFLIPGYRNRFAFEPAAARSIVRFGKWILLSTAFAFIMTNGDRVILGKLVSPAALGVYSIAALLPRSVVGAVEALSVNILFPLYSRLSREGGSELLRSASRLRLRVIGLAILPLLILTGYGVELVGFLYDPRYADAGWMTQILAVGAMASVLRATAERLLLARGDSRSYSIAQFLQAVMIVLGIAIGNYLGGIPGLIVGFSAARWVGYAGVCFILWRGGLWMARIDAAAIAAWGGSLWLLLWAG